MAHDDLNVNFMQKIICDVNKILYLAVISEFLFSFNHLILFLKLEAVSKEQTEQI